MMQQLGNTHQGLIRMRGIGAQVKNTVKRRKDFRPQTSDNAPMRGALRNDNIPYRSKQGIRNQNTFVNREHMITKSNQTNTHRTTHRQ